MALVVMIAIMEIKGDEFLSFALLRFLTMIIGVLAAFVVNLLFMPPKYETKLFESIHQAQDEIIRWTRLAGRQASDHIATKKSLNEIEGTPFPSGPTLHIYLKKNEATSKRILETKQENLSFIDRWLLLQRVVTMC